MTTRHRTPHLAWQRAVLQYPCPVCLAPPGTWCQTYSGHDRYDPHADRARLASADHWVIHDEVPQ